MTQVALIEAFPADPATGQVVPVRLAGGGSRRYDQLGYTDWRAGSATIPKFTAELGFDGNGWNGNAIPQASAIRFMSSDQVFTSDLTGLYWKDCPVRISQGDDETAGGYPVTFRGTIASANVDGGVVTINLGDLAVDLNKSLIVDEFAGTGGIEGFTDVAGRTKRRSFGRVFNVEGLILDKANNIYEFGDPSRPLAGFARIKDKGREGPMLVLPWLGTIAATFTALQAAVVPVGGAVVCPSIACAKWWTVASGPLTADLMGEVGAGYVETPAALVERVAQVRSTITVADVATFAMLRPDAVGVHVADAQETIANVIDRLTLGVSLLWVLSPTGVIYFRQWRWVTPGTPVDWTVGTVDAPAWTAASADQSWAVLGVVPSFRSRYVARREVYKPITSRRLGYQRNYRQHSDAEISAAILAADVNYPDGTPVADRQPAQAGADITAQNQTTMSTPAPINVTADYLGNVSAGQLPATASFRRYKGVEDVSADTVYSITLPAGITATVDNTPGAITRGDVTITGATTSTAVINVASTYAGATLYGVLNFTKQSAGSPPSSAGGGGGGTGTPVTTTPNALPPIGGAYAAITPNLSVVVGSGGGVALAMQLAYLAPRENVGGGESGSQQNPSPIQYGDEDEGVGSTVAAKWQYSPTGSGGWVDVAPATIGEQATTYFHTTVPKGLRTTPGTIGFAISQTGLTAGATAYFRIVAAIYQGAPPTSLTGTGSATP